MLPFLTMMELITKGVDLSLEDGKFHFTRKERIVSLLLVNDVACFLGMSQNGVISPLPQVFQKKVYCIQT